jgi:hypothetical protein
MVTMKTTRRFPPTLLVMTALLPLLSAPVAKAAEVRVSRFWHNHQPIYWPEWNGNGTELNRVQFAQDSIVLKPAQTYGTGVGHPDNNLTDIFGNNDRVAAYQSGPRNSLASLTQSAGYAISYSGSLIENVRSLGRANNLGYGAQWFGGYREAMGWKTPSGGPRLDPVGMTYHHALAAVIPKAVLRKEIQIFKQAWWKAWGKNSDLSDHSKGFFPTEMAFTTEMVDVLADEGYQWVIVASHHLSRTCPTYFQQGSASGNYGINSSPPNRADLLGPSLTTGWWYASPNPGNAAWNVSPFAYQLHKVKYVNPATGAEKTMVAVPSDDVLSYKAGYSGAEIGMVSGNIAPHANDASHPALVLPATDGDNAWGGGNTSWMESTPAFFSACESAGYGPVSIQDFVNQYGANATVAHVEDGAWIFPEMCYGSPYFLKWVDPPTNPNNLPACYPNTQIDLETPGFALKFWNWTPVIAAANWCETAEQILEDEGGSVEDWKIAVPYDWNGDWNGDYTNPNEVERAWHIFLCGLDSGFNYYGGKGNDDEVKQSLANRRAIEMLTPWLTTARRNNDRTPPTLFRPQRFPYNPGTNTFGWFNVTPVDGNFNKKMGSEFYVWTHAYDLSGIPAGGVVLKVRRDKDGVNTMANNHNETYAGGSDVEGWISIPMTKRVLPKDRATLNALANAGDIDYFIEAAEIADYYFAKVTDATVPGFRGKLLDYYIQAQDTKGNLFQSDIQHVFVVDDGEGGTPPYATFAPSSPSNCAPITVTFNATTSVVAGAATVYGYYRFPSSPDVWVSTNMTRTGDSTFTLTLPPAQLPATATQLEIAFYGVTGSVTNWENNSGANWMVAILDCDAAPATAAFDPAAPDGCNPVAIRYYPNEGPLQGAAAVKIHIGRNGWQDIVSPDPAMTKNGSYWEYTYAVNPGTAEINVCFNDGTDVWDNNNEQNWSVSVANCGGGTPVVSIDPASPVGCDPVTITYDPAGRSLAAASSVYIHIGRNGWHDVIEPNPAMTPSGAVWTYVYNVMPGTAQIDLVFNDGNANEELRIWDNNGGADWHFAITGCEALLPGLHIINPPSDISVGNAVATYYLGGTAEGLAGELTWSNALTGAAGTLPATAVWSLPDVALGVGANEITVRGSNITAAGTATNAYDTAADAAYVDTWSTGSNGGTGFGAWNFNHFEEPTNSYAGVFIGDPAAAGISGMPASSFGFYANPADSGANAEVQRSFSTALAVGDVFSFAWGLNWDSNAEGSYRGFSLLAGDTELVFINMSNSDDIWINGTPMFTNYGAQAMTIYLEYAAAGSLHVWGTGRDGTETYDETLSVPAGAPTRFKFYFNATDSATERQMYINNLKITSATEGGVEQYSDSVTITRQAGGDGPDIPPIVFEAGTGFWFDIPDGYTLHRVEGADTVVGQEWNWAELTAGTDYTLDINRLTILTGAAEKRMVRIRLNPIILP